MSATAWQADVLPMLEVDPSDGLDPLLGREVEPVSKWDILPRWNLDGPCWNFGDLVRLRLDMARAEQR